MRIVILGGSGFIGSYLSRLLVAEGYDVVVVSRSGSDRANANHSSKITYFQWDGISSEALVAVVEKAYAVVNLIGEGVADRRWTKERKSEILASRVYSAAALRDAVSRAKVKPEVVVQGSAVGIYGYTYRRRDEIEVNEYTEMGDGFLAEVCKLWEDAIMPVETIVPRLVVVRTGFVLGYGGGFLQKLIPLFKNGLGGNVGSGMHPFPWIHIDDEVGAIAHLIRDTNAKGVYNLVAPEQCIYSDFVEILGRVMHRPTFMAMPAWLLKLIFGREMTEEVLLGGKIIVPQRLADVGYHFKHPLLQAAVEAVFQKER